MKGVAAGLLILVLAACLAASLEAAPFSRADWEVKSLMMGKAAAKEAGKHLGEPYVWGGQDPKAGFDCAGFTRYVYGRVGWDLPRRAMDQFLSGQGVERQSLQAGDLVFFTSSSASATYHVGIYEGRGIFIHAPRSGGRIQRSRLDQKYFAQRYLGARRLDPVEVKAGKNPPGGKPTK